jgi:hypothetical protein
MNNRSKESPEMEPIRNNPTFRALIELDSEAAWKLSQYEKRGRAIPFLFGAVVLGGAGAVLAFLGKGMSAAALLLAAALGPAIINPLGLIFTCPLVVAGVLALFVRPRAPGDEPPRRRHAPLPAEA